MMRKKMLAFVLAAALLVAMAVPLFGSGGAVYADNLGPCNDSGEPGNSDFAEHNVRPQAETGNLGQGNNPGNHNGISICLGV